MAKIMKVGVLGGSFNPPHMGHLQVFLHAISIRQFDCIQVIPTVNHPFEKNNISYEHRLMMTKLAFNNAFGLTAYVTQEKDEGQTSYMVDSLKSSLQLWGENAELTMIVGSDVEKELGEWKGIDEIEKIVKEILVIPRGSGITSNVSSSSVRDLFNNSGTLIAPEGRKFLNKFVPRKIIEYILEHRLYFV